MSNPILLKRLHKTICLNVIITLVVSSLYVPMAQAGGIVVPPMPRPGTMVNLSPSYIPAHLQGMVIHPDNALQFDFIVNKGDEELNEAQQKIEYKKLVKYFLASLTVPNKNQWVNLSPYEHNRIIENNFGKTEMGRDLLAQDYLLKQLTSSLMFPEAGLGKIFWDKVYARAWTEYHTTNVPVNTFNKVWIVPDEATVFESGSTVYILKSHLKVMLEEDYVSLAKHSTSVTSLQAQGITQKAKTHTVASQVIREVILPALEREVNEGKNFSQLRQVISGMVLATWYKKALKESLLGKVYANKSKIQGINLVSTKADEVIYQQYLKAFKKGVYNYIKEDVDTYTGQSIPRKYFAGGVVGVTRVAVETNSTLLSHINQYQTAASSDNLAMVSVGLKGNRSTNPAFLNSILPIMNVNTDGSINMGRSLDTMPGDVRQQMENLGVRSYHGMMVFHPSTPAAPAAARKAIDAIRLAAGQIPVGVVRDLSDGKDVDFLSKGGDIHFIIHQTDTGLVFRAKLPKGLSDAAMDSIMRGLDNFERWLAKVQGERNDITQPEYREIQIKISNRISKTFSFGYTTSLALFLFAIILPGIDTSKPGLLLPLFLAAAAGILAVGTKGTVNKLIQSRYPSKQFSDRFVYDDITLKNISTVTDEYIENIRMFYGKWENLDEYAKIDDVSRHNFLRALMRKLNPDQLKHVMAFEVRGFSGMMRQAARERNLEIALVNAVTILPDGKVVFRPTDALRRAIGLWDGTIVVESLGLMQITDRLSNFLKERVKVLRQGSGPKYIFIASMGTSKDIAARLDAAMARVDAKRIDKATVAPGGIDVNADNMRFTDLKRDGKGFPLPLLRQDMAQLDQLTGFDPQILGIKNQITVPILMELRQKLEQGRQISNAV